MLDENITFETDGTSQCVTIHIASDSLVEDKENFTVVLLNLNDSNKILSQTTVYISSNVGELDRLCVTRVYSCILCVHIIGVYSQITQLVTKAQPSLVPKTLLFRNRVW